MTKRAYLIVLVHRKTHKVTAGVFSEQNPTIENTIHTFQVCEASGDTYENAVKALKEHVALYPYAYQWAWDLAHPDICPKDS